MTTKLDMMSDYSSDRSLVRFFEIKIDINRTSQPP